MDRPPAHLDRRCWWLVGAAAAAAAVAWWLLARFGSAPLGGWWSSSGPYLWLVLPAALACLIAGLAVLVAGWRRGLGEIALLGAVLTVLSVFTVAHAVAGALGDRPHASWFAMAIAVPAALVAGSGMVAPAGRLRRWSARRWRSWSVATSAMAAVGATVLVAFPDVVVVDPGPVLGWSLGLIALGGSARIAARQGRLHRIGGQRATQVTAAAAAMLGVAAIVANVASEHSAAWWSVHALNGGSVLAAGVAAVWLAQTNRSLTATLAPIVRDDPLVALEVGLTPPVRAFVAALDRKDLATREHVVRVADLAVRVADRGGIAARRLRDVALGALLHDIGKLVVPSSILTKPAALSDEEFAQMRTHAERGAALLEATPLLAPVAPLVRWHHERPDGSGYPDGLHAEQIPFEVAVISACDAWDAMTNDRHYRDGLGATRAREVLRDGAGRQWHPRAVTLVLQEVATVGAGRSSVAADQLGLPRDQDLLPLCADVLPPAVVDELGGPTAVLDPPLASSRERATVASGFR